MTDFRIGDPRLSPRFWRFVEVSGTSGCWLWTGALRRGYATYWFERRSVGGHVHAYRSLVGPIPSGWQIDHLCHDPEACQLSERCPHRRCVNPSHLKATTGAENTLRGGNPMAKFARATHCKHGHEFTPENTYTRPTGGRTCRECAERRRLIYHPLTTRPNLETHCKYGHELTPENLYVHVTTRVRHCRTCNRERTRQYRKRA
jgi:hypothetical protein